MFGHFTTLCMKYLREYDLNLKFKMVRVPKRTPEELPEEGPEQIRRKGMVLD